MKKSNLLTLIAGLLFIMPAAVSGNSIKDGFIFGKTGITSISAMTFGPESILFIGDSEQAKVYSIDLSDSEKYDLSSTKINSIDEKIAAMLGTTADQIKIIDLAIDPISGAGYLSVGHASGKPILVKVGGDEMVIVDLSEASHASVGITDAVALDAKDRRGRGLRKWTVSDIQYSKGKVMVTGLSNREFGSTFRSIPFPFNTESDHATLEIYHAAHGQYETHSPIKTFLPISIDGEEHLLASYTCTPLVVFPMSELINGSHNKGKTVAELGNRNTPLDIIEMTLGGERYVLMANSSRAVMKIRIDDIKNWGNSLSEPVSENSATAGIDFINLPLVNVLQLAKVNEETAIILQRDAKGALNLLTQSSRRL